MEAAGDAVVLREGLEGRPQLLGPAKPQLGHRLRQGHPGPDGRGDVVDRVRPEVAQPAAPPARAHPDERVRTPGRHEREAERDRRDADDGIHEEEDEQEGREQPTRSARGVIVG